MASLGEKLRIIRQEKGLSLKETAKELNISYSNLSILERDGRSNPSLGLLQKLANFYNIPLDELLQKKDMNKVPEKIISDPSPICFYHKNNEKIVSEGELNRLIREFYCNITSNMRKQISSKHIFGTYEDENKFCLILSSKLICLKSEKPSEELSNCLTSLWGKPIGFIERIEGCIQYPIKVYLTYWQTPRCSKINISRQLNIIIHNDNVLEYEIYDTDIKRLINTCH